MSLQRDVDIKRGLRGSLRLPVVCGNKGPSVVITLTKHISIFLEIGAMKLVLSCLGVMERAAGRGCVGVSVCWTKKLRGCTKLIKIVLILSMLHVKEDRMKYAKGIPQTESSSFIAQGVLIVLCCLRLTKWLSVETEVYFEQTVNIKLHSISCLLHLLRKKIKRYRVCDQTVVTELHRIIALSVL